MEAAQADGRWAAAYAPQREVRLPPELAEALAQNDRARQAFERLVLKMSPDEAGRFWIDRKIRGQKGAPRAVSPVELLRRVIVSLPNTVTYLNATDVTDDLKVLKVEGQAPQDPSYPLQFD